MYMFHRQAETGSLAGGSCETEPDPVSIVKICNVILMQQKNAQITTPCSIVRTMWLQKISHSTIIIFYQVPDEYFYRFVK